ncbi:MAG: hypothetical protein J6Y69_04655 [Treponema sp.]|nr:hypothetical protein [Treponema sp.]
MIVGKLIDRYKRNYYIPYQDLKDSCESNRLSAIVVSTLLLVADLINLIVILIAHHSHLSENMHSTIYLCIYTPFNLYIFIHAKKAKNASNLVKTIPTYLLLFVGLSASVFNFYFMETPHNGFLTYYITSFLFLFLFSSSPFVFLLELLITLSILVPGVYRNFGLLSTVDAFVLTGIIFGLSLYKRRAEKKHFMLLKKQKKNLVAQTFGNFTLLYDGKVVKFSRSKSLELTAYLIYKNGSSVNTKELIAVLYDERANSARYGASLRNLIVDVKHTFSELEVQDFFISEYNNFRINPEVLQCDYYDFLAGDEQAKKHFAGEFMNQYSWAEDAAGFLDQKATK